MSTLPNLDFSSVQVRDLNASKQFYVDVFGFEPTDETRPEAVVFKNSAGAIFAIRTPMRPLPESGALGTGASFWFNTKDVDAIYQRVVDSDGTVITPPQPGPFGKQLTVTDPDGYVIVFHETR